MTTDKTATLLQILHAYKTQVPEFSAYEIQLKDKIQAGSKKQTSAQQKDLIELYNNIYPLLEKLLWENDNINFSQQLENYQSLFREQEALVSLSNSG